MIDPNQLAKAILEEMKAGGHTLWIDPETHAEQHQFIAELIADRKERNDRRKRIEEKIAGSLILSTLLVIVGFIGAGALEWLRKHLN
jgi:hypothetical protein